MATHKNWSDLDLEAMAHCQAMDLDDKTMAEIMGRTIPAVRTKLNALRAGRITTDAPARYHALWRRLCLLAANKTSEERTEWIENYWAERLAGKQGVLLKSKTKSRKIQPPKRKLQPKQATVPTLEPVEIKSGNDPFYLAMTFIGGIAVGFVGSAVAGLL